MHDIAHATSGIRKRYLALQAIRWLPNGLLIPVMMLVLTERGFTLSQLGFIFAAQGFAVFVLELPTGGLADALGRRPVLLAATAVDAAALLLLIVANSFVLLVIFAFMQGIYRALESGPLESWLVDSLHDIDPDADIEATLGGGGVAIGVSIGAGALLSSGLVALGPVASVDALVLPLFLAALVRLVDLGALRLLLTEDRRRSGLAGVVASVRNVPSVITSTTSVIRGSRVLAALIAVELFWGFGMVSFETLVPVRLAEVTSDAERAAALFGPRSPQHGSSRRRRRGVRHGSRRSPAPRTLR